MTSIVCISYTAKSLKNFEGYLATLNEWCSLQKGSLTELPKAKSYIAIKLDSLQWQRAQVLKIINDESAYANTNIVHHIATQESISVLH